jgi:transposase-like protein
MTQEAWTDMRTPALAIVARGDQIQTVNPAFYLVDSQSNPDVQYSVQVKANKWSCTCAFNRDTHQACIHILAVRFRLGFIGKSEIEDKPKCEKCQSADIVCDGKRYNKSGVIKRYLCKACGHRFTGRDGFQKRRSDPEKIALALDLYFRGMSLRQIVEHFHQVYGLKIHHTTVYHWLTHYSKLAAKWMDSQEVKIGNRWNYDETVININGENHFLWNLMDSETRMLLATHVSKGRGLDEARVAMKKAKKITDVEPQKIYTDGLPSYPDAIKREFGRRSRFEDHVSGNYWNPHKRVPSIKAPESNNIVERLHGTEKSRTKVMRAFDQLEGAASLMDGWRVHYDAVRDHMALGMTPAEAAGIPKIEGFRWLELLKLSISKEN